MNRAELVSSMNRASSELLREKGFISFVDVLIHMGKLTKEDHESWRMRRIPYLERAIRLNLSQISHLLAGPAAKWRQRPSPTTQDRLRLLGEGSQTTAPVQQIGIPRDRRGLCDSLRETPAERERQAVRSGLRLRAA